MGALNDQQMEDMGEASLVPRHGPYDGDSSDSDAEEEEEENVEVVIKRYAQNLFSIYDFLISF